MLILLILILLILKLKKFWVSLGKITKRSISLANFQFGYLKGPVSGMGFIFARFVCIERFG